MNASYSTAYGVTSVLLGIMLRTYELVEPSEAGLPSTEPFSLKNTNPPRQAAQTRGLSATKCIVMSLVSLAIHPCSTSTK